ncbi:MAG: 16S rRNA (guanine(966)-N(2))-methyltransferase RsmD [Zetaproteobacteria bacterium]|nr:MAG: 16S rRNA (guanine(966)-N(2))-methyltransferase RsmD [Zetaproteobacteria bacterium]
MRITAGELRGRGVRVLSVAGLRPTPSKVRQAMFNILGAVDGFRMLDLYAGSGIMALEALSRGAARVASIERHRACISHMRQLCRQWGLEERWQIIQARIPHGLPGIADSHFDLIFADPPYASDEGKSVPVWLEQYGIGCRRLVIETSARFESCWPASWHELQCRCYGDTCLHFLEQADHGERSQA